jgi:hypothetical protein
MAEPWLPSLKTPTPQEGFELAAKLARLGVKLTQPSAELVTSCVPVMSRTRCN